MTNEEMQRKMEFIVEQQAQFAVNLQKLEEMQVRAAERTGELEGAIVAIVNLVGKLAEGQERLAEGQERMAEGQARADARLAELAESQKRTDERLNAFIVVVERYITNGRGDHPTS